jgi:hypothetical protein
MRKVNKTNPHLILAKKWKKCVGFIGAREIYHSRSAPTICLIALN